MAFQPSDVVINNTAVDPSGFFVCAIDEHDLVHIG